MVTATEKKKHNEEIVRSIHLFSNEAFAVAKSFVAGDTSETIKLKTSELKTQLPKIAARMQEADQEYRADLNRTLSEARLDLDYVLAGGGRPSSIRLSHVIREQSTSTHT